MKLLLTKTISKLGIVGDVVHVKAGYGRNYLLPQGLATDPTSGNVRRLAEARRLAELERIKQREELKAYADKLEGAEVTVYAKANEDGLLYGSVGPKEIAAALAAEGHAVDPKHIVLAHAIRELDKVAVEIKLGEDTRATVNVWIVREKSEEDEEAEDEEAEQARADAGDSAGDSAGGTEAGSDDTPNGDG